MISAAQCDETSESYLSTGTDGGAALKQMAAERLAAHRSRRAILESREAQERREQIASQAAVRLQARRDAARAEVHPDASRVRDAVAARYRESLSYREALAAEAKRALEQAQAEAEIAARNAIAVAAAQRQLLEEIEQWNRPDPAADFSEMPLLEILEPRAAQPAILQQTSAKPQEEAVEWQSAPSQPARLQVRLHAEMELPSPPPVAYAPAVMAWLAEEELAELEEEIEFRRSPEFGEMVLATQVIPANIIEFPRHLVASRKARPRLAEGPLREDGAPEPQLRIFEVQAEQISSEPQLAPENAAPVWQGLLLGAGTAAQVRSSMSPQLEAQLQLNHQFYAATIGRRMFSTAMDAFCIVAGFAGFAAVVVKVAGESLRATPLPLIGGAAVVALVAFTVLYQMLFFTLNDATPGMRAAHLAFCTYNEQSPARRALRRRLISTALAACPLGLGLIWMALDSDRLGWHDRMSRMYPRSY